MTKTVIIHYGSDYQELGEWLSSYLKEKLPTLTIISTQELIENCRAGDPIVGYLEAYYDSFFLCIMSPKGNEGLKGQILSIFTGLMLENRRLFPLLTTGNDPREPDAWPDNTPWLIRSRWGLQLQPQNPAVSTDSTLKQLVTLLS